MIMIPWWNFSYGMPSCPGAEFAGWTMMSAIPFHDGGLIVNVVKRRSPLEVRVRRVQNGAPAARGGGSRGPYLLSASPQDFVHFPRVGSEVSSFVPDPVYWGEPSKNRPANPVVIG